VPPLPDARHPLDATAVLAMVLLCALWGFQQVAIKLAAADVSLLAQAGIRSAVATLLLLLWAALRRIPLWQRDRTLVPGLLAGLAFGAEFAMIYAGLAHTTAARMIVFLYLAPCFTALGLTLFVPGERLRGAQWAGIAVAFGGLVLAFADGFAPAGRSTLAGDALGALAALLWAATTVLIRATPLARVSATKVLFYQLAVSALLLLAASRLLGEPGVVALTPRAIASLAFQSVVVAFASYLVWFWLLTRYLAGRLAAFSFLAPLFGVLFGTTILGEPLSSRFAAAALLVGTGITLVNARWGAPQASAGGARRRG
jgi:drug/metabolite transporter (DMT)-like permease